MNPYEFQKYATKHLGISSLTLHDYQNAMNAQMYPQISNMTTYVIDERLKNFRGIDVFARLIMDRIIFLGLPIDDYVANIINAQLLFLQSSDASKDISIYINSPGGGVYAGLGIYDTMQLVSPDIATICTGMAASMAAVILCSGASKKRAGLPHSRVMIHQPLGGASGQATDIAIMHTEIQKLKKELYEILASHSGQDYEKIWADSERDYWMTSEEAKEYGLIDEVIGKRK